MLLYGSYYLCPTPVCNNSICTRRWVYVLTPSSLALKAWYRFLHRTVPVQGVYTEVILTDGKTVTVTKPSVCQLAVWWHSDEIVRDIWTIFPYFDKERTKECTEGKMWQVVLVPVWCYWKTIHSVRDIWGQAVLVYQAITQVKSQTAMLRGGQWKDGATWLKFAVWKQRIRIRVRIKTVCLWFWTETSRLYLTFTKGGGAYATKSYTLSVYRLISWLIIGMSQRLHMLADW